MEQMIVTTVINVLMLSSMYILTAVGFAFLFSMLGILNFAHGAVYMIGGYLGYEIITSLGFNPWAALTMSVLVMAAFGALLEKYFFRPFVGNFNRTMMVCIAIIIVLQTSINILEGGKVQALPAFVDGILKAGPVSVSYQRIVSFLLGMILLGVVSWFVNRTRLGHQMQAISQNMKGALLQGINVHRISMIAVALGCGLAALAGCLMGSYLQLSPFMGDAMLNKVLVLVVLAGIGSISGIFITGLLLGTLDAVLPLFIQGAASDAVAVIIVTVLLLLRPRGFFGHDVEDAGDAESSEGTGSAAGMSRKWSVPATWLGFLVVLCLVPLVFDSPYTLHILTLTFIYVIASSSLRTITTSGQIPLAHGAFMGVGAYCAGVASKLWGVPAYITIPAAGLVTMALGILISYPFARLRAFYYAMASLFFGLGVIQIIYALSRWTGGYAGLYGVQPIFGGSKAIGYYFFLGLTVVCLLALYRLEFSRIGTNLKAIAQSHMVASSVGIDEAWYRIFVVGVGCFFVGLAGAGYAHYNLTIGTSNFGLMGTMWFLVYWLVGGTGSFAGPIVGTFILYLLPEFSRDLKMYSPFVSAAILLTVVYGIPQGFVSLPRVVRSWFGRGKEAAHAA
ncbi:MAG: ABC transporter permease [Thermodesulfobacteriota bacterium]|jgi:branched-chain amino acid transport system permease protein